MSHLSRIQEAMRRALFEMRGAMGVTGEELLESFGFDEESVVFELECWLSAEFQFAFRDDWVLRPDMTVNQAEAVVWRCLRQDEGWDEPFAVREIRTA